MDSLGSEAFIGGSGTQSSSIEKGRNILGGRSRRESIPTSEISRIKGAVGGRKITVRGVGERNVATRRRKKDGGDQSKSTSLEEKTEVGRLRGTGAGTLTRT